MQLIRQPAFADRFYPADPQRCAAMVEACLADSPDIELSQATHCRGGLVPHAGWVYSGSTAAYTCKFAAASRPETVAIFGAVHVLDRNPASLFPDGIWETPLGPLRVDSQLAAAVRRCRHIRIDPAIHRHEHSIEVELPFIRRLLGDVQILPLMVRPGPDASEVGRLVAAEAASLGRRVVFLASTDLTHYGPAFYFEPAGRGAPGLRWAKEVNDRRFISRVAELDAAAVVPEAVEHQNACGAGAVAATIAAAREFGAAAYRELRHCTSAEQPVERDEPLLNSVGYQAGIFVSATS
jgi:hypothetical protein